MMCSTCGAWTEVDTTRRGAHGTTRRKRRCANGHTFFSVEIAESTFTRARPAILRSMQTIEARRLKWKRDLDIYRDGRGARELARAIGMSHSEIGKIRARMRKELS